MPILHNQHGSIVITENTQVPSIVYVGCRLSNNIDEAQVLAAISPPLPQAGMDEKPVLSIASTLADPIFIEPALKIHCEGRHWAPQWRLQNREVSDTTIIYKLFDQKTGLLLVWKLETSISTNVFTLSSCIENKGSNSIELVQWLSTLPLPEQMTDVTSFSGRWVHEFQPQHSKIPLGSLEFKNIKGRTSHDNFPGLLIGNEQLTEHSGQCLGFHLGWSGNHCQRVERSQNGLTQYQAGIELLPGEALLKPGDIFDPAPLYFTYTENGLSGISESFQSFVRSNILKFPEAKERPVHINTWEAIYFDHRQEELDTLAKTASECGAERFVLDDGWFINRRDDKAGLGDWQVDKTIYPEGLHPLKATLKKYNLGFGLWFEPEMINKESNLYRDHPNWLLQLDGINQISGRNQWVLDITQTAVQEYLFSNISSLLSEYPIEYIKWDMNRDLSQAGNQSGRPAYYQYTRHLYKLLERIRKAHPSVEIESCASGGGRMDFSILEHTHRFWLSDCNDANERQNMQQWASLFFPAEVLGSHVGPVISHTTSRSHSLRVRAGTALFGHMGIEWDVRQANQADKAELAGLIKLYKDLRKQIHAGIRRPLSAPDRNQIAFSVEHDNDFLISVFQQKMPHLAIPGNIQIPQVDINGQYEIELLIQPEHTNHLMKQKPDWMNKTSFKLNGEILMKFGLSLPVLDPESLLVLKLKRCIFEGK